MRIFLATVSVLFFATLVSSVVGADDLPKSPCPGIFDYIQLDKNAAQWTGSLQIKSEYTLHGLWIRLFFDNPVEELKLVNDVLEVKEINEDDDRKTFLLKNKDYLLKKNDPLKIEFAVHHEEGSPAPTLIGYRLNARDLCPGETD